MTADERIIEPFTNEYGWLAAWLLSVWTPLGGKMPFTLATALDIYAFYYDGQGEPDAN